MRQRRFRFVRGPDDRERDTPAWLITRDRSASLCPYAVRLLRNWAPASRDVVYTPTLDAARQHVPHGLLQLDEWETARLLAPVRSATWGDLVELWF